MSKRDQQLFQFLLDISANVEEAAIVFANGIQDLARPEALAARIKELETKGDELTGGLVTLLNATYITPLDREDFLKLAITLDDIVDGLEACSVRFDIFNVTKATPVMMDFAQNIVESSKEVAGAISKLHAKKLREIHDHAVKINQLEKTGDHLLRNSLRALFQGDQSDVLDVIKHKEIYEILEDITDRCEDVADVLESVIVKNA